mmetsp:Transcript_4251/g.15568  ORF Transcript_4251/g.15568 Transcript_4251/m.15568 type:complete len:247 (-) Transcript_4251:726-1466(-)
MRPTVETTRHVNILAPVQVSVVLVVENLQRLTSLRNLGLGVNNERLLLQANLDGDLLRLGGFLGATSEAFLLLFDGSQRRGALLFKTEFANHRPNVFIGNILHRNSKVFLVVIVPRLFVRVRDDKIQHARRRRHGNIAYPPVVVLVLRLATRAAHGELFFHTTNPLIVPDVHDQRRRIGTTNRILRLVPEHLRLRSRRERLAVWRLHNRAPILFERHARTDITRRHRHFSIDFSVRLCARTFINGE